MKKKYRKLNLLPFYFRNIGLGIIGLVLLAILVRISGLIDFEMLKSYKTIGEILLLISFLFITLAKGRIEDERTIEIRMQLYTGTFIYGVVIFIMVKVLNFIEFFHSEKEITAFYLLCQMFIFYFIMSSIAKRKY